MRCPIASLGVQKVHDLKALYFILMSQMKHQQVQQQQQQLSFSIFFCLLIFDTFATVDCVGIIFFLLIKNRQRNSKHTPGR